MVCSVLRVVICVAATPAYDVRPLWYATNNKQTKGKTMNDFFRLTIDTYGVSITSEPLSVYVSWTTMGVVTLAVVARYAYRAIRARGMRTTTITPMVAESTNDGYAW